MLLHKGESLRLVGGEHDVVMQGSRSRSKPTTGHEAKRDGSAAPAPAPAAASAAARMEVACFISSAPSGPEAEGALIHTGWLWKLSRQRSLFASIASRIGEALSLREQWHRRFFALSGHQLRYFRSPGNGLAEPLGCIDLDPEMAAALAPLRRLWREMTRHEWLLDGSFPRD